MFRTENKNIKLFYLVRLFWIPLFRLPVLYLYLTQWKHFSPQAAFFLLGLQELLLIFLEIPTGVIADKFSRTVSVGLGYVITSLPFVFLPFTDSFLLIAGLFVIKAVGKALISGADTSLLYDTLLDLGREKEYKHIVNRSKIGMMICTALCIAAGGRIAEWNIGLTMILPFPLMCIGAIAAFCMDEPQSTKKAKQLQEKNYLRHTFLTIKHLFSHKRILIGICIFILQDALAVNMKRFYTPIFENLGYTFLLMGGVTSILYLIKGLVAGTGSKIMYTDQVKNIILYGCLATGVLFFAGFFFSSWTILPALGVVLMSIEIIHASIEEFLHEHLASHNRATAMSSISMLGSIGTTAILYIFGVTYGFRGIGAGIVFLGTVFFAMVAGGYTIKRRS